MNILYVSKVCSQKKFNELFELCIVKPQQQAQKFHYLLVSGFAAHEDIQLTVMSDLPISHVHTKRIWWYGSSEIENKMIFKYLPHLNVPVIGNVVAFFAAFFATAKWCLANRKNIKYIICDVLNLTISVAAKAAGKLFDVKAVAIVTDIPSFMQEYKNEKRRGFTLLFTGVYTLLCSYILRRYDAYVILTEQMNRLVNPRGKPNIVIEGMVDLKMLGQPNLLEKKYREKVVIYAGALYEKYGVKKLIEAFVKVAANDARLWLFGSGELEREIKQYKKKDDRIEFFGVISNRAVIEEEIKAILLVNPRPSSEEFTQYSFPSKNMEYMVSGTPLLTTKLPGMPEEYYDYVYLFEDESVEGMAKTLDRILKLPKEELHAKGLAAKEFVLREKNNLIQAKRIIDMIMGNCTKQKNFC